MIERVNITTKGGNTLQLFYNPDNNLVVLDLIAANEKGGSELLRQTLQENVMLEHTRKPVKKPSVPKPLIPTPFPAVKGYGNW